MPSRSGTPPRSRAFSTVPTRIGTVPRSGGAAAAPPVDGGALEPAVALAPPPVALAPAVPALVPAVAALAPARGRRRAPLSARALWPRVERPCAHLGDWIFGR